MKKIFLTLILLLGPLFSLSAQTDTKKYCLDVHDFTELKVIDGINVVYSSVADSAGKVSFECSKDMASHLIFSNKKNSLRIQVDFQGIPYGPLPVLHVYSTNLLKVENSGDSTVTVRSLSPANINNFSAKIVGNGTLIVHGVNADEVNAAISTGSGHLIISGKALKAKLSNVGTGPLEANSLECGKVKCVLVGTGPIDCHVNGELSIIGAGSGSVYYSGNPKKVTNRSLGVKARAIE